MTAEEAIKEGYKFFCLQCNKSYKEVPSYLEEKASCLGSELTMCKCGSDLFMSFEEYIQRENGTYEYPEATIENRMDILDL